MKTQKLLCVILAGIIFMLPCSAYTAQAEAYWPAGPEVEGPSAIVMEASTGTVLYEKNAHEQRYPASITKIMTTLLALENSSMDEEVTFSHDAIYNIERDSTHISRDVGEIMTMEQCLYAVMLASANECAYAVAEHVGKGYDNFIQMMNDKAAELGCTDTHFNNPHGLPDEQHYTSAYDMALISRAAMENEQFRIITRTARYTIPFTNKHPNEETYLVNHHKMLTNYQTSEYLYEYCIGGKTGYTDVAGNTLVTFAEKDGVTLICVVMKETSGAQYTDTRALMDYCFENFTLWNVAENESDYEIKGTANEEIFGTAGSIVDMDRTGTIILPVAVPFTEADCEIVEAEGQDDTVARLEYSYAGRVVGGADIKITNAQVTPYSFHTLENVQQEPETPVVEIRVEYILLGIGAVAVLGGLIALTVYLIRNFYILRHRVRSRRRARGRFKVIKKGRHSRWRSRW